MITGRTQILGVIGDPVEHTSSPVMHNAALQALGLDWAYVAFHVLPADLQAALRGMRALQLRGLNVTVPHKQAVMAELDEIAAEARIIGAVNTIANEDGRLCGYNTDGYGFIESLRQEGGMEELPSQVVLLGAGGAARAILHALLQRPEVEKIVLLNRTVDRAEALAGDLDPAGLRVEVEGLEEHDGSGIRDAGLLINSTSIGMHPNERSSPLRNAACLHAEMLVLDIVYKPLHTRLMEQAEAVGARVLNGLGMLVFQGARALEIWTGEKAPVEVMKQAALERFGAAS